MVGRALITSLFAAAVVTASASASASAVSIPDDGLVQTVPNAFIFEFEDGHNMTGFMQRLGNEGKTRMRYNHKLFKGVSVQLNHGPDAHERALLLAQEPAVRRMWRVRRIPLPYDRVEWIAPHAGSSPKQMGVQKAAIDVPDMWPPHQMTQIDKLRAKGITGKGIKLAIVDSGIDFRHPALGGCFGEGCLVSFGTDLVGDEYTGLNEPKPGPVPTDCMGHGTHVAGIIAAQQNEWNFTGAAPDVKLGIYRVFGCTGESAIDVLISAFIQAYQDGADIISSSIGGFSGWPEDPWSEIASRIVEAGVPCILAAGNSGSQGLFFTSNAGQGHGVTAVASVNNVDNLTLFSISNYTIDDGGVQHFRYVPGTPSDWNGVKMPLFVVSLDPNVTGDACSPLADSTPDLSTSIVLIRRGNCTFVQKAQNVAAHGAKRIIFSDDDEGITEVDLSSVPQIVSAAMVEGSTRSSWISTRGAGSIIRISMVGPDLAPKKLYTVQNKVSGGSLSDFSSWGPTFEMDTKPQVSAVGGMILSTYPLHLGGYAVFSGTSMATPQIAGIVALIAQARDTRDPTLITSLLSTTAKPVLFNNGSRSFDFLAPVPQQGGGLVQADAAAYATTLISPSSLSFNDTDHRVRSRNFTINNSGTRPITFLISHLTTHSFYLFPSNDSIHPASFPNEDTAKHASLSFSSSILTLGAGEFTSIEVLCAPPIDINSTRLPVWSGYISINGSDGTSFSIPYQGASGSLHSRVVLEASGAWIANSNDANETRVANGTTFTVPGPGVPSANTIYPSITWNLVFGSRYLRADVVSLNTTTGANLPTIDFFGTKSIGQAFGFPQFGLPRLSDQINWNGQLNNDNFVPSGTYRIVMRALRVFGDETRQEDWDVSETEWFNLRYSGV